jgi:hypothetical protein
MERGSDLTPEVLKELREAWDCVELAADDAAHRAARVDFFMKLLNVMPALLDAAEKWLERGSDRDLD